MTRSFSLATKDLMDGLVVSLASSKASVIMSLFSSSQNAVSITAPIAFSSGLPCGHLIFTFPLKGQILSPDRYSQG
jgi:hypothetical protein